MNSIPWKVMVSLVMRAFALGMDCSCCDCSRESQKADPWTVVLTWPSAAHSGLPPEDRPFMPPPPPVAEARTLPPNGAVSDLCQGGSWADRLNAVICLDRGNGASWEMALT